MYCADVSAKDRLACEESRAAVFGKLELKEREFMQQESLLSERSKVLEKAEFEFAKGQAKSKPAFDDKSWLGRSGDQLVMPKTEGGLGSFFRADGGKEFWKVPFQSC